MKTTVTITSKGQLTLPADIRKKMDLIKGDKLHISFSPEKKSVKLTKPVDIEELSQRISSYIKPGTKPVINVDEYYQEHRGKFIR